MSQSSAHVRRSKVYINLGLFTVIIIVAVIFIVGVSVLLFYYWKKWHHKPTPASTRQPVPISAPAHSVPLHGGEYFQPTAANLNGSGSIAIPQLAAVNRGGGGGWQGYGEAESGLASAGGGGHAEYFAPREGAVVGTPAPAARPRGAPGTVYG